MLNEIIVYSLLIPGYILLLLIVVLIIMSGFNKIKYKSYRLDEKHEPFISLIVPAHNEEEVIERTIKGFLKTKYNPDKKEMVIVNDGSSDKTKEIVERYASIIINSETGRSIKTKNKFGKIILVNRLKGGQGKAYVSNDGKKYSKGEILVFIDADVEISKKIFLNSARHFIDPNVGAVAGYVHIRRNKNFLNGFVFFESLVAQKIVRAGFNVLGIHYIVPGGCAVFRREILEKVGGYSPNSLAEDTDLTWKVLTETKSEIHFDSSIVVVADEPKMLKALWNQRVRWSRGNLEVTLNHKHKIGRKKYGKGMTYIFPFWLASVLVPIVFLISTMGIMIGSLLSVQSQFLSLLGIFLGFAFYLNWILGTIVGKGEATLQGLISPGIPLLIIFTSGLIFRDGLNGLLRIFSLYPSPNLVAISVTLWVFLSIPGTYLSISISKKYKKTGEIMQLIFFGYWIFLVISVLHGYTKEAFGHPREWIRTIR